jgi:hypothetical protein
MNCDDLAKALSKETPLPLDAREHVKSCKRCQELVEALNMPVAVESLPPATLQQIAEGIATNLRPVSPVAPAGYFFAAFSGVFVSIVAFFVYRMGALAIAVMTPLETVAILTALAVSTGLLAYSLVHQMIPGSHYRISPRLLPVGIAVSLTIMIAVLFRFQHEQNFWRHAWPCIRVGTPIGVLAAVPFWLILRRGAILSPGMTGATTGLLAGLVGTSVLEIHCPNLDAWHILASHLGVAVLCALAGLIVGLAVEIKGYAVNSLNSNHKGHLA